MKKVPTMGCTLKYYSSSGFLSGVGIYPTLESLELQGEATA